MPKKSTLLIIFLIVFIDLMGFGIVIPLLPLYADQYQPSPVVFGLLMAAYSLMQFLFAPLLGRLSDRYGRRPVLFISLAGTVVGYLLFAFQHSLAVLFLARIVNGIAGANVATAQAVIADVTKPEERAKGMGMVGAAFGLGFLLGPAIGGFSLAVSESAPGIFAACFSGLALLLAIWKLPETWTEERRYARVEHARGWFSFSRLWTALGHPKIGLAMIIFFLASFAFSNFESTFALFLKGRMHLSNRDVTWLFVYVGLLAVIIQGGLIGRLVVRFGERALIMAGAIALVPAYLFMVFVPSIPWLMAVLPFLAIGAGFLNPALSSMVSRLSTADEQGGMLGVYQSVSSLARITGPFCGVYLFKSVGERWPFWVATGVALMVLFLAATLYRRTDSLTPHS